MRNAILRNHLNPVIVQKVAEKARLWSSSYRKDSNRRHLEKQNEDLEKSVTPSLVSTFENSESTRKAVAYIGQLSGAHSLEVNQSIYTLIRDFILTGNYNCKRPPIWSFGQYDNWRVRKSQRDRTRKRGNKSQPA